MVAQEIERKWLLRTISPALWGLIQNNIEITYAYLNNWRYAELFSFDLLSPEENGSSHFCKVKKTRTGISKTEETHDISAEEFLEAFENPEAKILTKTRLSFDWAGFIFEIDIYNDVQLATLEVEFESVEAANAFDLEKEAPKELFAEILLEVSGNEKFSNAHLALSQEYQA